MPSSARRYKPPRSPGQRVAKRNARKEKQLKCVLASRRGRHHPPRDGSHRNRRRPKRARRPVQIGAGTDPSTPVARRAAAPERAQGAFSLPPGAAHSLFVKNKRGPRRAPRGGERRSKGAGAVFAAGGNEAERTLRRRQWGVHPRWTSPLAGASTPVANLRRPASPRGCAPKREGPPLYFSSNTDTYTVPVTSNPSLAFT